MSKIKTSEEVFKYKYFGDPIRCRTKTNSSVECVAVGVILIRQIKRKDFQMKKVLPLAIVVIVIIVIVGFAVGHKKNNNSSTSPANNSSSNSNSAPATDKISIMNMSFTPASFTVKKGVAVTWTNDDSVTHTVTADSGNEPNSGNLSPGKSYSFTFSSTGTFAYHCTIHPNMHGSVTVTD